MSLARQLNQCGKQVISLLQHDGRTACVKVVYLQYVCIDKHFARFVHLPTCEGDDKDCQWSDWSV